MCQSVTSPTRSALPRCSAPALPRTAQNANAQHRTSSLGAGRVRIAVRGAHSVTVSVIPRRIRAVTEWPRTAPWGWPTRQSGRALWDTCALADAQPSRRSVALTREALASSCDPQRGDQRCARRRSQRRQQRLYFFPLPHGAVVTNESLRHGAPFAKSICPHRHPARRRPYDDGAPE